MYSVGTSTDKVSAMTTDYRVRVIWTQVIKLFALWALSRL